MNNQKDRRDDPTRRRRVAGHYLIGAEDSARLHKTVSLAARALEFPIGQINILDDEFMYTIGDFHSGGTILPREESMCQFVVDGEQTVFAVGDLSQHPVYRELPGVRGGFARSYLGVQLTSRESTAVGTLCVMDRVPRHITIPQIERIQEFGSIVQDQLDLFRRTIEFAAARDVSSSLADALAADEIVPWYQPVFDLHNGVHMGFEALARWQRPDGTVIRPDSFVAAAEDSDLVIDLDRAVARAALHDVARWRGDGNPALWMGVNLSTRHLELADGASFVIDAIQDAGLDPRGIVVEITETRLLTDLRAAAAAVGELQEAGCRVLLDDFASGWSSLEWLLELGANGIKIDRSVTSALGTRVGDAVCRAVVSMTAELGMSTTIEGISDAAQLAAAKAHGFRFGQGYHWSPPIPASMVDATI